MTDTLTRAANDASEALGMSVAVREDGASRPTRLVFLIEVYAPMDSDCQEPIEYKRTIGIEPVLAYLEGLETGARIMRERHARLRRAADDTYLWCCTYAQDFRLTDICQSLKAGLAELEDRTMQNFPSTQGRVVYTEEDVEAAAKQYGRNMFNWPAYRVDDFWIGASWAIKKQCRKYALSILTAAGGVVAADKED